MGMLIVNGAIPVVTFRADPNATDKFGPAIPELPMMSVFGPEGTNVIWALL